MPIACGRNLVPMSLPFGAEGFSPESATYTPFIIPTQGSVELLPAVWTLILPGSSFLIHLHHLQPLSQEEMSYLKPEASFHCSEG